MAKPMRFWNILTDLGRRGAAEALVEPLFERRMGRKLAPEEKFQTQAYLGLLVTGETVTGAALDAVVPNETLRVFLQEALDSAGDTVRRLLKEEGPEAAYNFLREKVGLKSKADTNTATTSQTFASASAQLPDLVWPKLVAREDVMQQEAPNLYGAWLDIRGTILDARSLQRYVELGAKIGTKADEFPEAWRSELKNEALLDCAAMVRAAQRATEKPRPPKAVTAAPPTTVAGLMKLGPAEGLAAFGQAVMHGGAGALLVDVDQTVKDGLVKAAADLRQSGTGTKLVQAQGEFNPFPLIFLAIIIVAAIIAMSAVSC